MKNTTEKITFAKLTDNDVTRITPLIADAFEKAILEGLGEEAAAVKSQSEVFNDEALKKVSFGENVESYIVSIDDHESGIAVIKKDIAEKTNSLELFSISPKHHSRGIGARVWNKVEELYPEATAWETTTPTFAIKNVNFYVNKCGFHIVELLDMAKTMRDKDMTEFMGEMGEDDRYLSDPNFRYSFRFQKKLITS